MFEFASASRSCSLATHAQFRRTTVCVMGMVVDEGDGGGGGDSDAFITELEGRKQITEMKKIVVRTDLIILVLLRNFKTGSGPVNRRAIRWALIVLKTRPSKTDTKKAYAE